MTNREKYDKVFLDTFAIARADLKDTLAYSTIPTWDSVGHMGMIAALEDSFSIAMDTDDVIGFSSYKKGLEILAKYGVKVD
jgi:acyl carrier protein